MHELAAIHSPGAADALLEEAAALRAHPAFEAAVIAYCAGLVRYREQTRLVSKLSANETRLRVIGYLLHLSAVGIEAGGDGGVSYGTLREISLGEVSDRVLNTMLALLQLLGLVESWRSGSDRRVKFYRPSSRLLDLARAMYANSAAALDCIEPAAGRAQRLAHDPAFFNRMLVEAGRAHAADPPAGRMPEFIAFFGAREGAGTISTRLLLGALSGPPVASRAALARQFGLSKTQVADVIAAGAGLGYFSLDPTTTPVPTPLLAEHLTRWISIELAFMARHMQADVPSSFNDNDIPRRNHA